MTEPTIAPVAKEWRAQALAEQCSVAIATARRGARAGMNGIVQVGGGAIRSVQGESAP